MANGERTTVSGVRFEKFDDREKRMLGLETAAVPVQQFLDTRALAAAATEQQNALADLTRLASERDGAIAKLDRDLPRDIKARRAREIAAGYEPRITKLKTEIDGRASVAEQNRASYDLRALVARARFSGADHEHAAMAAMWSAKIGRLITPHFVEFVARVPGEGAQAAAYAGLVLDELDQRESEPAGSPRHVTRAEREKILTALEAVPTVNAEMHAGRKLIDELTLCVREAKIANGEGTARDQIAVGLLKGDLGA